jgi:hypothetical protein
MDKTMDRTMVLNLSEALNRVDGDQDLFLTLARCFWKRVQRRLWQLAGRWGGRTEPVWRRRLIR